MNPYLKALSYAEGREIEEWAKIQQACGSQKSGWLAAAASPESDE
jgi:hypothetical protein